MARPREKWRRLLAIALGLTTAAVSPEAHRKPAHRAPVHQPPSHESARARQNTAEKLRAAEQERQAREAEALQATRLRQAAEAKADALAAQRVQAATDLRRIEGAVVQSGDTLRAASLDQRRADEALARQEADFSKLLPLLLRMEAFPAETLLAVPAPPEQALRGLLVARGLARALNDQAAALLRARAESLRLGEATARQAALLASERAKQARAAQGLEAQLQEARAQAARAADAGQEAEQAAASSAAQARTLRGALAAIDAAEAQAKLKAAPAREPEASPVASNGKLATPVAGRVIRAWGADAEDGPATGITFATAAGAFVASPCAGRVAFAAPFRSYGQLLIVECQGGSTIVLAGLARLDASIGRPVRAGEPVGRMPDGASPSLYVELRQNGRPVNPAPFLNTKG